MKIKTTYLHHFSKSQSQPGWHKTKQKKWPAQTEQTINQHLTIGSKARNPSRDMKEW